ncbi:TetR/AcrR family transcriptional regulator [Actinophytocola sediminis]
MTWPRAEERPVRRALSQDLIVDTALSMLGQESLDTVSMRRVAQELDTGAASLYAHVSNKDELHELMLDRLLGRVPLPEPDPQRWQEQIREIARTQYEVLTAHPGIARVAMETTGPTGPNSLLLTEGVIAVFRKGGLSQIEGALAFGLLSQWVAAFAMEAGAVHTNEISDEIEKRGAQIRNYMRSRSATFPNLLGLDSIPGSTSVAERYEFGLNVFLAGLPGNR